MKRKIVATVVATAGTASLAAAVVGSAHAEEGYRPAVPGWMKRVLEQSKKSPYGEGREEHDRDARGSGVPRVIPQTVITEDGAGRLGTFQPGGAVKTEGHPFFTPLKSPNGRSCFTCHVPEASWSFTPEIARERFFQTNGKDPLFAPFDGQNCPDLSPKTPVQRWAASSQVLTRGNIRIGLPLPSQPEWVRLEVLRDPTRCATDAQFGLPSGVLNMYRRPLPSTNLTLNGQLGLLTSPPTLIPQGAIMWDGREPSLESQFADATMGHAQGPRPSDEEIRQGVAFELGLSTAQFSQRRAGRLDEDGATGGPFALAKRAADEAANGVTFELPPPGTPVFDLYDAWATNPPDERSASIQRGQDLFNNRTFTIKGVAGFNDLVGGIPLTGTCTTCHNNKDVGADVVNGGLPPGFLEGRHLGIGDNVAALDQSGNQTTATVLPAPKDLPLFAFWCPQGSIGFFANPRVGTDGKTYDVFETSDPGVALLTGKCADLGKFKVPRLRGLAGRAPYFHGGNAKSLEELVEFYNARFDIALTRGEKQDLVNFLNAL